MTRLEALEKAKTDGYTKGIYLPYTYHARKIDNLIKEAKNFANDPDYQLNCDKWEYKEDCINSLDIPGDYIQLIK
jgi:hypothetical protein